MKYEKLAEDIIDLVGGASNVNSLFHCVTRLRFKLKDESLAKTEELNNLEGVVTVRQSGGQYQVVIGNHVGDVYKAVLAVSNITAEGTNEEVSESQNKVSLLGRFVDTVGGVFTPILGILAATGMLKGFTALFVALGWLGVESGTYALLNAMGDSLMYFFPIFLGYTAMKKFGGSPFLGMVIGAALVYPSLGGLTAGEPLYTLFTGTLIESDIYITFLGIPVILMEYGTSVIPIIFSAFVASKVEKKLTKVIPDVIKSFCVPLFTIIVVVPLTFMFIGPVATWAAQLLGGVTVALYEFSPILTGVIIGGFWQVFVMFGLHWGLVPVGINNLVTMGFDPILASIFPVSFAQTGAVIAIYAKTKDEKLKTLSIPAIISGIFGVTEPAIYGITLPLKKPFIMSCIAGAVAGGIGGIFGSVRHVTGGLGIFMIPSFIHPEHGLNMAFWGAMLAAVAALILGFTLTYVFGMKTEEK